MNITYARGRYRVAVLAQNFGTNDNGKWCLEYQIRPLGLLTARGEEPIDGALQGERSVRYYFASAENTRISIEQLRLLGWAGSSFTDFVPGPDGPPAWSLVGQTLLADCDHETYRNRDELEVTTERWRFIATTSRSVVTAQVERTRVRELDARFAALLTASVTPRAAPPSPGQPGSVSEPPTVGPTADDEVPF